MTLAGGRPIKSIIFSTVLAAIAVQTAALAQQMTPSDLEAGASSGDQQAVFQRQSTGQNPGTTGGGSAADSDQAIEVGDYARAEAVAADRLKTVQGGAPEIAVRLSLVEAKMWQGKFQTLPKELKAVESLLKRTPNVSANLTARYFDDQSWMCQLQGDVSKSEELAREAITNWKKAGDTDIAFLCGGIEHLAHLLEDKGALVEAAKLYQESLDLHAKLSGPDSVACANQMERIAALAFRNGDQAKAQQMYRQALDIKDRTNSVFKRFSPQKAEDAVFYRFLPGAPNVSRETADGITRERIVGGNVIVEAALLMKGDDFTKNSKAMVRITNNGSYNIHVLPQGPDLIVLKPKIILAKQVQGQALAETIEKKGNSKAKWIRFWGSQATTTSTTNVIGGGGFMPYGGYMPPAFGYGGYGNSWYNSSGGMTTMVTSMPDYQARERAYQRAQAVSDQSQQQAANVRESELGPSTVAAGGSIEGCLYYDQTKFDEAILRIPVGKAVFEFRFDHLR